MVTGKAVLGTSEKPDEPVSNVSQNISAGLAKKLVWNKRGPDSWRKAVIVKVYDRPHATLNSKIRW